MALFRSEKELIFDTQAICGAVYLLYRVAGSRSQNWVDWYLKSYHFLHMKTTLDIPSGLLSEAMRLAGAKTKRAAVLAALDDFSRRGRMREMAMRLGNSETFMSSADLETLRLQEKPE